jgi:tetratricopeptide (TPR) repeat protein
VLIVLLHRPGETPPGWGQPAILTGIGLHALSGEGTERMIASILQVERIPPGLAGVIHERTAGNPLFTEELCKALRDDGTLVIHRDSVRLTRAQQDLQMPHSVEAVIRSRLDRLDPDALTTLRLASVVGRFFGGRLLSRLVPERLALSECLERLLSREQIQAAGRSSEPEYRFKHSLTQQVVYETLLLSERQELHERVGAAIAELYADRIEEQVETLAHHFERSGNAERAVQYHEMAARKAAGTYAFSVSGSHYAKAFGRLGAWAPTPERLEKAIRIALRWANVSQGEPSPELLAALESLLEGARGSGNKLLYARLLRHTGWVRLCLGQFPLALALLNESKDLSRSLEDRQQNAHVLNWLGRAYWGTEQFVLAIRNLREGLDLYGEPGYEAEAGLSLSYLSISLGGVGDFPEAERVGRRAVDLGKEIGNKACESWAWNALATVQALRGNWAECRRLVIDHLQMAMAVGNSLPIAMNRFCLGDVEHHLGSRAQGFEQMQQALASARALGTAFMDRHQAYLACCAAQQGLEAEARLCLERFAAARLGRNRGQVYALCAQAYLDARSGSTGAEGVRARMGEALGLAAELRLLPDLARCQLACAELLARAGDSDGAQEALKRALESFGALGMDWWREQAHSLRGRIEQGRLSLEWAQ